MAIYHCSVKPISRGAGQSIVAAAAYRHGCRMEDKRTGEVHDYSRKRGVTVSAAFFPSDVDCAWATKIDCRDKSPLQRGFLRSQILWNAAELAEKRKDARLGREIVLALPSELSPTERKVLAAEMAQHIADRYGVAVDAAIHAPSRHGDERNWHVHMLVSARRITPTGFGEKTRELDDRERGPAEVEHLRAEWARLANRALEQAGQHVQIDHRSFRRQGVKRMPSRHLGASATALERRGVKTRIGDGNRAAARLNALAGQLEAEQAACVSLTEQAKRAAQEVRQCGVDLSREASSVSRPAMPRPTPQRAMSSPFLVERAGAGPGSLHGAVERREGTPAAVRPEAARPEPQRAAEAPQRPVAAQQVVAPRPEPQRAAEAPQRAMSSPFLVERAGAGPGSLHGAVERREGTPAAVRPEAARPTPQRAVPPLEQDEIKAGISAARIAARAGWQQMQAAAAAAEAERIRQRQEAERQEVERKRQRDEAERQRREAERQRDEARTLFGRYVRGLEGEWTTEQRAAEVQRMMTHWEQQPKQVRAVMLVETRQRIEQQRAIERERDDRGPSLSM